VKPIYLMDPKSLKIVDGDRALHLQAVFESDFNPPDPDATSH
jgi:hypothetical protein